MFTGIVTDIGEVADNGGVQGMLRRVRLHARYAPETISVGASIACAGPCLTVVAKGKRPAGCWFEVEAAAETLGVTTIGDWRMGTKVNLERSLKIGDETLKNVRLAVVDWNLRSSRAPTGSHIPFRMDTPMLLGVDFLKAHRVFVAHSQRKLYFTYEGGQVFLRQPEQSSSRELESGSW